MKNASEKGEKLKVIYWVKNLFAIPDRQEEKMTFIDKLCTVLLALCPILQHYKGPFKDGATSMLILLFVYFGCRLLFVKKWRFEAILPLITFSLFEVFNHGIGLLEFAREALLIGFFIAAASGAIRLRFFSNVVVRVALIASTLIIFQYICYYLFGFHLQLVPTAFLEEGAAQWIQLAQTGRISVSGNLMPIYRPSAFFLEPSHLTVYCFSALALVLLSHKMKKKYLPVSILISAGILLSTSGMGIALVLGIWGIYFLKMITGEGSFKERVMRLVQPKSLLWIGACLLLVVVAYFLLPSFQMSVNRIFVGSSISGKNAIEARMGTGIKAINDLSGIEFWFGKQNWGNVHNWNMAGFFYTFYTQGLIGMLLSFGFYIRSLFKTKNAHFWIALVICGLSLITVHTHAAFYMLFYVFILLGGYDLADDSLAVNNFVRPYLLKWAEKLPVQKKIG